MLLFAATPIGGVRALLVGVERQLIVSVCMCYFYIEMSEGMPQGSIRLLSQSLGVFLQPPQLAKESRSVPGANRWHVLLA